MAETYTRASAPLARKYTDRIFESKDGTLSMKIVNYNERHNFRWNDLLTKSNRTEIQTYEVEEWTFGHPVYKRIWEALKRGYLKVSSLEYLWFDIHSSYKLAARLANIHLETNKTLWFNRLNWSPGEKKKTKYVKNKIIIKRELKDKI